MSKNYQKSWTRTFDKYCPYTSTHLWWGITRKTTITEQKMRENLTQYTTDSIQGSIFLSVFDYFINRVITDDFLMELVQLLDEPRRILLEQTVYSVMIKKELRPQNCVVNCIKYVKLGLVKYYEELNQIIK